MKYRPDILDNLDIYFIPITKIKNFLDNNISKIFIKENWIIAKFVRQQFPIIYISYLQILYLN